MNILRIPSSNSSNKLDGFYISVNPEEALSLVASLIDQMASKNPNIGRREFYTDKGKYFTISVKRKDGELKSNCMEEERKKKYDELMSKCNYHDK